MRLGTLNFGGNSHFPDPFSGSMFRIHVPDPWLGSADTGKGTEASKIVALKRKTLTKQPFLRTITFGGNSIVMFWNPDFHIVQA